ncbi:MAG: alpha/beta hydrolase [Bacteroidetes bacterium]|nr:alpha/beta hydrolase [Bacteroidota bacterium]MCL6099752.1 alpha/beta hydrolase [Bacteroidota bacterium]
MKNKTALNLRYEINSIRMLITLSLLFSLSNFVRATPASEHSTRRTLTYAYADNIHINYEMIGYGNKTIVLLHGFGASLHTWDDIKELFPKDEFTLYLIDLKGFGNSSKPEDDKYTIQEQSKIVEQFIKDINTDSLYLVGHSFGGAVALLTQISLLNEKSKTKISKLVLIDCLAYAQDMPAFIEYLRTPILNKLTFLLPNKYRAEYILDNIFYDKDLVNEKLIDRYSAFFDGDDLEYSFITSAEQIDQIGNKQIMDDYKNIPTACLIIWGKNDLVLPVENGIRLSKELPNARLEIINECGHVPQEEKPGVTFKKIYAFIKGQ